MKKRTRKLNQTGGLNETATPERIMMAGPDGIRVENIAKGDSRKRQRVVSQTPLDRHLQRGEITRRQWEAGQVLHNLHRKAGLAQRMTANYDSVIVDGGGRGLEPGEASAEYFNALKSIGRDLSGVAQWVVIQGNAPADWAKTNGHAVRGGIVALRLCLDGLGDFFGMPRD